jgi:hypothetical protein
MGSHGVGRDTNGCRVIQSSLSSQGKTSLNINSSVPYARTGHETSKNSRLRRYVFRFQQCVPEDISTTIPIVRPGASGEHTRHPAYYQESISWRGHPPYCSLVAIARSLRSTNCETSPSFCNPPTPYGSRKAIKMAIPAIKRAIKTRH